MKTFLLFFFTIFILLPSVSMSQDNSVFTPYNWKGFSQEDVDKLNTTVTSLLKDKILSKYKDGDENYKKIDSVINDVSNTIQSISLISKMTAFLTPPDNKNYKNTKEYKVRELISSLGKYASKVVLEKIQNEVKEKFEALEDTYRIQVYDHLSIGNNSSGGNTKFENLFAPTSSVSFMYTFEANQIPEKFDLWKGLWSTFGGILKFSSQSTNSLDSISALAKIFNYGPDVSFSLNARVGTTPHRYLNFLIGASTNLSYINSKSVDNKIVDGSPMISFSGFIGLWAIKEILFTGAKFEKRFMADKDSWLFDQVNKGESWNLYMSVNFKNDLNLLVSYLLRTNNPYVNKEKNSERLQVTFGTYFDLRGLKL